MPLTIPDSQKAGIASLAKLDQVVFDRLVVAVENAKPSVFVDDLATRVASVAGIGEDEAERILSLAASLFQFDLAEKPPAQLALEVAEAASVLATSSQVPDFRRVLSERIARLLALRPLGITAKAFGVLTENERVYCRSRIVSDLRPVFSPGPADEARDSLIIHSLRITFHEGRKGETRDFFVAMDADELADLRGHLDRALAKERALRSIAEKGGAPCLPVRLASTN